VSAGDPAVPAHLARYADDDRTTAAMGIEVLEVGQGRSRTALVLQPDQTDHRGVASTGQLFTLADAAVALASNSYGPVALLVHADVEWVSDVRAGTRVEAACQVLHRRTDLGATFEVRLTDPAGDVVGLLFGTTRSPRPGTG
jgi:acyl-CoA thioesterase